VAHRVFLLSPANVAGLRGQRLLAEGAGGELALRLRNGGAPLGEVMSHMSQLYFRGKLGYARAFATPPAGCDGALVITQGQGLIVPERLITAAELRAFGEVPIDHANASYSRPLERDARRLRELAGPATSIVLLGSIATAKYAEILLGVFGASLLFPSAFVGRGDMSRGGMMLRAAAAREELAYEPLAGAVRHGRRPAKLPPLPRKPAS
jgi:hypothetical protein